MHALYMNNYIDMDTLFEGVFKKLVSPDFGKNLGGELPLFIQPIPNSGQTELKQQVERLSSRLQKKDEVSVFINTMEESLPNQSLRDSLQRTDDDIRGILGIMKEIFGIE